jgi:hypothetical protein
MERAGPNKGNFYAAGGTSQLRDGWFTYLSAFKEGYKGTNREIRIYSLPNIISVVTTGLLFPLSLYPPACGEKVG